MYDPGCNEIKTGLIYAISSVETSSVPEESKPSGSDQVVRYWSSGEDEENKKFSTATQSEDSVSYSNPMVQNPLCIDLILDNLAIFLDYSSLKTSRMVCRKWKDSFHTAFEKKTTINVDLEISNTWDISNFTRIFNEAEQEGKIYRSWHFKDPQILHRAMKLWIAEYGEHIETLKLGPNLPNLEAETRVFNNSLIGKSDLYAIRMTDLSSLLFQWCRNLKHLSIPFPRLKGGYTFGFSKRNPVVELITLELGNSNRWICLYRQDAAERFAQNIIKCVKSVEKLILRSPDNTLHLMSFTNCLLSEKDKRNCLLESLTTLDLSEYDTNIAAYGILSNVNFKNLKHIKIGFLTYNLNIALEEAFTGIQLFLNRSAPQLESLYLLENCKMLKEKNQFKMLEMPALKVLKIQFSHWEVGVLDFAVKLPKLTNLFIFNDGWEDWEFLVQPFNKTFQFIDQEHKSLETLTWIDKILDMHLVARVVSSFPNLKQIQISLAGEVFSEVLNQLSLLKNLKDLQIWIINISSENLNLALIANLPCLSELKKLTLYFRWEEKENRKFNDIEKMLPESGDMVTLTLDGVRYGFLKSPKLVSLFLEGFKISNEAYDMLMESEKLEVKAYDYVVSHIVSYEAGS